MSGMENFTAPVRIGYWEYTPFHLNPNGDYIGTDTQLRVVSNLLQNVGVRHREWTSIPIDIDWLDPNITDSYVARIARDELDMSGNVAVLTEPRKKLLTYSYPSFYEPLYLYTKRSRGFHDSGQFFLLSPFDTQMWLIVVGLIVLGYVSHVLPWAFANSCASSERYESR